MTSYIVSFRRMSDRDKFVSLLPEEFKTRLAKVTPMVALLGLTDDQISLAKDISQENDLKGKFEASFQFSPVGATP